MIRLRFAVVSLFVFALAQPVQPLTESEKALLTLGVLASLYPVAHVADSYWEDFWFTNYSKNELYDELTSSLSNQDYGVAYWVALKNPQAIHEIAMDSEMKHKIKKLIEQEESKLIHESAHTTPSLNPFKYSTATQLTYLANLLKLIKDQETHE
jgi:hypothetical protein